MLTGGQLVVPFRVRLLGRVSFWPRRLVRSSAESTTGEISLAFGHAMEVRLSRRLRSGVPPFTPYKVCLFLVMVEVFIVLLARNCNINYLFYVLQEKKHSALHMHVIFLFLNFSPAYLWIWIFGGHVVPQHQH